MSETFPEHRTAQHLCKRASTYQCSTILGFLSASGVDVAILSRERPGLLVYSGFVVSGLWQRLIRFPANKVRKCVRVSTCTSQSPILDKSRGFLIDGRHLEVSHEWQVMREHRHAKEWLARPNSKRVSLTSQLCLQSFPNHNQELRGVGIMAGPTRMLAEDVEQSRTMADLTCRSSPPRSCL